LDYPRDNYVVWVLFFDELIQHLNLPYNQVADLIRVLAVIIQHRQIAHRHDPLALEVHDLHVQDLLENTHAGIELALIVEAGGLDVFERGHILGQKFYLLISFKILLFFIFSEPR
jgi:hypothetical protein